MWNKDIYVRYLVRIERTTVAIRDRTRLLTIATQQNYVGGSVSILVIVIGKRNLWPRVLILDEADCTNSLGKGMKSIPLRKA